MTKYNILTVANKDYIKFLKVFVGSCQKNCTNLDELYVADIGLGSTKKQFNDVTFIETSKSVSTGRIHSAGWASVTKQKTKILLDSLDHIEGPIILIDNDVCVLKDFSPLINPEFDIQISKVLNPTTREDLKVRLEYVASFIVLNNPQKCKEFVKHWIGEINNFEKTKRIRPHETPALNKTIKHFANSDLKIGGIPEDLSCSVKNFDENSYSAHFRSAGSMWNIDRRLKRFGNQVDIINFKYNG